MNPVEILNKIKNDKHTFTLTSDTYGPMVLELTPFKAKHQIEAAGGMAPLSKWKRYIGDGTQQTKSEEEVLAEMETRPELVENAMTVSERLGAAMFVKCITNVDIVFDDQDPPQGGFRVTDFISLVKNGYGNDQLEALAQKIADISGLAGGQQADQSKSGRGNGEVDVKDDLRSGEDLPEVAPPSN